MKNESGSRYGWIYFLPQKGTISMCLNSVEISHIEEQSSFSGKPCAIVPGVYRITNLMFDAEKSKYRFRISDAGQVYEGPIGAKSLSFRVFQDIQI